jgi:phosphoribosylanthranilate isomerase
LKKYTFNKPFFLSGGISEKSKNELLKINHEQLYAVDLNSKFEIVAGLKDITKIKSFINYK